jgi:hypothetical protein
MATSANYTKTAIVHVKQCHEGACVNARGRYGRARIFIETVVLLSASELKCGLIFKLTLSPWCYPWIGFAGGDMPCPLRRLRRIIIPLLRDSTVFNNLICGRGFVDIIIVLQIRRKVDRPGSVIFTAFVDVHLVITSVVSGLFPIQFA